MKASVFTNLSTGSTPNGKSCGVQRLKNVDVESRQGTSAFSIRSVRISRLPNANSYFFREFNSSHGGGHRTRRCKADGSLEIACMKMKRILGIRLSQCNLHGCDAR